MSLLSWTYAGRWEVAGGRQHALAGDDVFDDELGKGVLDKIDGTFLLVEFGQTGERKEVQSRPAKFVYAVVNRPAPAAQAKPTGLLIAAIPAIARRFAGAPRAPRAPSPRRQWTGGS